MRRVGLSQRPILSFRWSSARTLGSHHNFLHVIEERFGAITRNTQRT